MMKKNNWKNVQQEISGNLRLINKGKISLDQTTHNGESNKKTKETNNGTKKKRN